MVFSMGRVVFAVFAVLSISILPVPSAAQSVAAKQAIAEAAAGDRTLAAFYRENGYDTLWTGKGSKDRSRRKALLQAFENAADHGLPAARYDAGELEGLLRRARSANDRGRLEVHLSKLYLEYARDVSSGVLDPHRVNSEIFRRAPVRDPGSLLTGISRSNPRTYIQRLAPSSPEYVRLMEARMDMQRIAARNAWGNSVPGKRLDPGDSGQAVVALRDRLIRMGYMKRSVSAVYDDKLTQGVRAFQAAHGLATDGIAGPGTLDMINASPETRLAQITVAMERLRWMNFDLGRRYVEVNIPDFSARIVDGGRVTFTTRAVVGAARKDWRTPEFSDEMEFMVVNPSWYVPRSIAVDEYLPMLQEDPFSVTNLQLLDENGSVVPRGSVDFASLDEDTWSFLLKEPPSQGNALGRVKFMFPNRHNIYLHDTPQRSLFSRETRAFSHGCIRLHDPMGFAHALLARQSGDPEGQMKRALAHTQEYQINLQDHVPVHLVYLTARADARGNVQFFRDVYGRDAQIYRALRDAGVELMPARS